MQAMMPIFDAAKNAVLLEAEDLTHLGLAHVENVGQLPEGFDALVPIMEANFHENLFTRARPYEQVPTAHYTVEFLLDVFSNNSTASEAALGAVVAEADKDGRFVSVKEKLGGSSAAGGERGGNRKLLFGRE